MISDNVSVMCDVSNSAAAAAGGDVHHSSDRRLLDRGQVGPDEGGGCDQQAPAQQLRPGRLGEVRKQLAAYCDSLAQVSQAMASAQQ